MAEEVQEDMADHLWDRLVDKEPLADTVGLPQDLVTKA